MELIDTETQLVVSVITGVGEDVRVESSSACCVFGIVDPENNIRVVEGVTGFDLSLTGTDNPEADIEFSDFCCAHALIFPGGSVQVWRVLPNGTQAVPRFTSEPVVETVEVKFSPSCCIAAIRDGSIVVVDIETGEILGAKSPTTDEDDIIFPEGCSFRFVRIIPVLGAPGIVLLVLLIAVIGVGSVGIRSV